MNPSATRTITYDIPRNLGDRSPAAGEFIRSIARRDGATLSVYLILGVREIRRRKPSASRRFKLHVQRGYSMADIADGERCWWLHWNSRHSK